ncbi:MAG: acyloxyacyl hydrolase [Thermodesulfobacteriota bacterium]
MLSNFRTILVTTLLLLSVVPCLSAEEPSLYDPNRYGLMVIGSNSYSMEETINVVRLAGFASFDYDKIWRHWAPDNLRWKVELNTGLTVNPFVRSMSSLVMIAQLYIVREGWGALKIRPFIEGGVGCSYADFRVRKQGSRSMFNPQFGAGTDFTIADQDLFLIVRQDHFSNGGLKEENRGLNFLSVYIGFYF